MKKWLLCGILLTAIILTGCQQQPPIKAQAIIFTEQNGTEISLTSLAGKWVFINFWASWCKPCYQEISSLNAFAKEYKNKVQVFGVSYDHVSDVQLVALIKKMNIQFSTLKYDPSATLGVNNLAGLPATLIINPAGKLVKTLYGEQTVESLAKQIS